MKPRIFTITVLLLALFASSVTYAQPVQSLTVDGQERTYTVHEPAAAPDKILIALHSFASSGKALRAISGLDALADEAGVVVAYPNSLSFVWDDGRSATDLRPTFDPVDDMAFLLTLADELSETYDVPRDSVYITGLANGGTMAMRLVCEHPDAFAGVVAVNALMWSYQFDQCPQPSTGAPDMLIVNSTADPDFPPIGRNFLEAGITDRITSLSETVDFWTDAARCSEEPATDTDTLTLYDDCDGDTTITVVSVIGGGAAWAHPVDGQTLNRTGIDVSRLVIDFVQGVPAENYALQDAPFDGEARGYTLYVPQSYDPAQPAPLVTVLHGRPSNAIGMAYISDMNATAEREGFIVLYPDGVGNEWNYVRNVPIYMTSDRDDVAFITHLIQDLSKSVSIDLQRTYVTGFSNGGFMTQRIACEAPDSFAAFAVVGATVFYGLTDICADQQPVDIMFIHGTRDVSVPWEGMIRPINGQQRYMTLPVPQTLSFWLRHNECGGSYDRVDIPSSDPDSETDVSQFVFKACPDDVDMTFYAIEGGGHNWPGVPGRISDEIAGEVNMDINANDVIWDFFEDKSLENPAVASEGNAARPSDETTILTEIDPQAAEILGELRTGGYVIYMRHALTNRDQEDTDRASCDTQRNLDNRGREQASVIGLSFQRIDMQFDHVYSTDYCRTKETASLVAQPPEVLPDEAFFAEGAVTELLGTVPEAGYNTLIIGHGEPLLDAIGYTVEEGEAIIVRPSDDGSFEIMSTFSLADWLFLADTAVQVDARNRQNDED